jgi:TolB-like protein
MPASSSNQRFVLLAVALVAMVGAAVAGWMIAEIPPPPTPEQMLQRPRVAVLPFVDPETGDDSPFNQMLSAAFSRALTLEEATPIAVIRPDTTARMVSQGMSPANIGTRTRATFLLAGGHRESDHGTFIELWNAAGDRSILRREFEVDENQPAYAPAELVSEIVAAINQAMEQTR